VAAPGRPRELRGRDLPARDDRPARDPRRRSWRRRLVGRTARGVQLVHLRRGRPARGRADQPARGAGRGGLPDRPSERGRRRPMAREAAAAGDARRDQLFRFPRQAPADRRPGSGRLAPRAGGSPGAEPARGDDRDARSFRAGRRDRHRRPRLAACRPAPRRDRAHPRASRRLPAKRGRAARARARGRPCRCAGRTRPPLSGRGHGQARARWRARLGSGGRRARGRAGPAGRRARPHGRGRQLLRRFPRRARRNRRSGDGRAFRGDLRRPHRQPLRRRRRPACGPRRHPRQPREGPAPCP
jgi:hypothetical protein